MLNKYWPIVVAIFFMASNPSLQAQEAGQTETLFGNGPLFKKENIGFAISPMVGLTALDGGTAVMMNVRAGAVFSEALSIGGFYNTSLNYVTPQTEVIPNTYLDFWSAGGYMEYTIKPHKLVHVTFPLYIGAGELELDLEDSDSNPFGDAYFLSVEPSALVEVNLHKNVRLNIGAGYRWLSPTNYRSFDNAAWNGVTGYLGFRFGLFR